jgi:hypothetical protein
MTGEGKSALEDASGMATSFGHVVLVRTNDDLFFFSLLCLGIDHAVAVSSNPQRRR